MEPVLSVIIPVYNAERTLRTAIDSVIMQRCPDVEIVVVDDGSTDGSWEIIESYGDQIVALRQKNAGANVARNHGATVSRGRFLKFLDADDFLFPEALRKQIEHAEGLPERGISFGETLIWSDNLNEIYFTTLLRAFSRSDPALTNPIMHTPGLASLIYPRDMFHRVGGFGENIRIFQDVDLFIRSVFAGGKPEALRIPIFTYRQYDRSNRVSGRQDRESCMSTLSMYKNIFTQLDNADLTFSKDDVARWLAQRTWQAGRRAVRASHNDVAADTFSLAREIHRNCRSGYPPYKTLAFLFGPFHAEAIWMRMRSVAWRVVRRT